MVINSSDRKVNLGRNDTSIFLILIMMALSIYWEVFELIVDILAETNMQYSPFDTLRDMMFNAIGCIMVAFYVRWFMNKYPNYDVIESFKLHPAFVRLAAHSNQKS